MKIQLGIPFILLGLSFGPFDADAALRYQSSRDCHRSQLVYENAWGEKYSSQGLEPSPQDIAPECVLYSMDSFDLWARVVARGSNARGLFVQCSSEHAAPQRSMLPACKTKSLVSKISSLYNEVSRCLDIPPKLFYMVLSEESGFYINALARRGDVGLGQLTPIAVEDVNINWNRLTDAIFHSSAPSCQGLKAWLPELQATVQDVENICPLVVTPKNPARNLLYAMLLFQQNRNYFLGWLSQYEVKARWNLLLKRDLTEPEIKSLVDSMSLLSYNMGFPAVVQYLDQYLKKSEDKIEVQRSRIVELNQQIADLRSEFAVAQEEGNLGLSRQLRDQIRAKQKTLNEIYESLRLPIFEMSKLSLDSTEPASFPVYLTEAGGDGYLKMLIRGKNESDQAFRSGYCSQFPSF